MNKITAFSKLVRWQNLLMTALMMCLVYYCLMSPLFGTNYQGILPSSISFILLLLAMIFIVAGGYVVNDLFDVEIDKINKPDKLIVSRIFSERETNFFYWSLTFIGLICGAVASIMILKIKFLTLFMCFVLLACLLYSYSYRFKRKLLIGNLIVAVSVMFAVFLPWLFEMLYLSTNLLLLATAKSIMVFLLEYVLIYCVFAFLTTLIREIVKDMEDYQGDKKDNCRTAPIAWGMKNAKFISLFLVVALFALVIFYQYRLYSIDANIPLIILFVVDILCIAIFMQLMNADKKEDYHKASTMSKIVMLFGLLTMAFI